MEHEEGDSGPGRVGGGLVVWVVVIGCLCAAKVSAEQAFPGIHNNRPGVCIGSWEVRFASAAKDYTNMVVLSSGENLK